MATRPPPTGVKRKETTTRPARVGLAAGTWGWIPAYGHCIVEAECTRRTGNLLHTGTAGCNHSHSHPEPQTCSVINTGLYSI